MIKDDFKMHSSIENTPLFLRDEDIKRENQVWENLLSGIKILRDNRHLMHRVFISYAWLTEQLEKERMQHWLKKLQDFLEKAGLKVFLDLRDMQGHLNSIMRTNLENSDYILPILTPRFLERVQDKNSNLAFEFQLMLEQGKKKTILYYLFCILETL